MADITLEDVVKLVDQLNFDERTALMAHLRATIPFIDEPPVTREKLLEEHERLRAEGAFDNATSLRNKYASPDFDLSFEELEAGIREFSNQWEEDIDDLFD